jgi:hypothetical protein
MADIFLSYGGAQRLVEAFEKGLSRQGHKVYSDADFDYRSDVIVAKLRQFDAIIVIWSNEPRPYSRRGCRGTAIGTAHSDSRTRIAARGCTVGV